MITRLIWTPMSSVPKKADKLSLSLSLWVCDYLSLVLYYRDDQEQLAGKLAAIEKKIIVGGENLLEKAEEQERLLEESAKELDERKKKEEDLRRALEEKEVKCLKNQLHSYSIKNVNVISLSYFVKKKKIS